MNFNKIAKSFNQVLEAMGGGWVALLLGVLIVAVIIFLIYRSGKQIKFRIPFLPASIGTIKIGKADVDKLAASKEGSEGEPQQKPGEAIGALLREIDGLTDNERIYELPVYLILSQYQNSFELANDIGGDVVQRLSLEVGGSEASGFCIVTNEGILLHHETPRVVVEQLLAIRPERPLDGIICGIPVDHINIQNGARRQEHIDWYFREFWHIQQLVEFTLPVFVLVPGMQRLDGFDAFWTTPNAEQYFENILGWSTPSIKEIKSLDRETVGATDNLSSFLRKISLELAATSLSVTSKERLEFNVSFDEFSGRLESFLAGIFDENPLSHPFFFRGIYFTGQLEGYSNSGHLFLSDLFHLKIFREHSLAQPRTERLISSSKKLKTLQYASMAAFLILGLWSALDLYKLFEQNSSLRKATEEIRYVWSDKKGFSAVDQLLEILSRTDASNEYCCGPLPLTALSPINNQLEEFFQNEVFGNAIFPVMECRNRKLLQDRIEPRLFSGEGRLLSGKFEGWLNTIDADLEVYSRLQNKMIEIDPDASQYSVAQEFSELIAYLFKEEIPDEFFGGNAELYLSAVSSRSYRIERLDELSCPGAVQNVVDVWPQLVEAAEQQIFEEVIKQAAPIRFIQNVIAFESADIDDVTIDQNSLQEYLAWHASYEDQWEVGYENSFCGKTANTLRGIASGLAGIDDGVSTREQEVRDFEDFCTSSMTAQYERDNSVLPRPLYSQIVVDGSLSPRVSDISEEVFDFIDEMSQLSFVRRANLSSEGMIVAGNDFLWSVDLLNQAITYVDEYVAFAKGRFPSLSLPEAGVDSGSRKSYLTQAIVLAQLQRALVETVKTAKTRSNSSGTIFGAVDQKEANLALRVSNFRKALNPLVSLLGSFEQLGFMSAKSKLMAQSHAQASHLLGEIDGLYESNSVFEPRSYISWEAHNYPEAFFGLVNESQIKDYFRAQEGRSEFIAENYAAPVVTFLSNTDGSYAATDLVSRWSRTLIEINKKRSKNPSNEIEDFSQFMMGAFAETNLSNCHEKTKTYRQPLGNSVYSASYRSISAAAISHCQKFRADSIESEYESVRLAFNEHLAAYFPFNTAKSARSLPASNLRKFLRIYPGKSNGLAERVRVLAWKYPDFQKATEFVKGLDNSLLLLDQIFSVSNVSEPIGLEVVADLNARVDDLSTNRFANHIKDLSLEIGKSKSTSTNQRSLRWNLGDPIELAINWASGSPYKPGKPGDPFGSNQLVYSAEDTWSVLRLIQRYRTKVQDQNALTDEAVLLEFDFNVLLSDESNEVEQASSFARMTFYGMDPQTKERVALQIPEQFPMAPPQLKKG